MMSTFKGEDWLSSKGEDWQLAQLAVTNQRAHCCCVILPIVSFQQRVGRERETWWQQAVLKGRRLEGRRKAKSRWSACHNRGQLAGR